jgi:hypothetical protein
VKTPFWLDTNVFVEAKNRYYTFERVPKFWSFLSQQIEEGTVCSPNFVYDELVVYKDQLAVWIKTRKTKGLCVTTDGHIQAEYKKIADHVATNYTRPKSEEFLTGADPWVITCALHVGGTVVTQESTSRTKKVRIPTICKEFNVACIDTFQMLNYLNAKF